MHRQFDHLSLSLNGKSNIKYFLAIFHAQLEQGEIEKKTRIEANVQANLKIERISGSNENKMLCKISISSVSVQFETYSEINHFSMLH